MFSFFPRRDGPRLHKRSFSTSIQLASIQHAAVLSHASCATAAAAAAAAAAAVPYSFRRSRHGSTRRGTTWGCHTDY